MLSLPAVGIQPYSAQAGHQSDLNIFTNWLEGNLLFQADNTLSLADVKDLLSDEHIYDDKDKASELLDDAVGFFSGGERELADNLSREGVLDGQQLGGRRHGARIIRRSPGVPTNPAPKWCSQTRFTRTRAVSGLFVLAMASASSRRPLPF